MRTGTLAFLVIVLIAGLNFIAVQESNGVASPFLGSALRFLAASALFFGVVLARRLPLPRGRALVGVVAYGLLAFAAGYAFAYQALARIDPGLAAIVMATVPLLTLLLAAAQGEERLRAHATMGALIVVAGMGVISWGAIGRETSLLGVALMLGAAVSAAQTGIVVRRFPRVDPAVGNAIGMAVGGVALAGLSLASREAWTIRPEPAGLASIAYLILLGSVGMFFLYLGLLQRWTASAVSYTFVLAPVVAIALGIALDRTEPTWSLLGGGLLVTAGVYLGALRRSTPPTVPPAPAAEAAPVGTGPPSR